MTLLEVVPVVPAGALAAGAPVVELLEDERPLKMASIASMWRIALSWLVADEDWPAVDAEDGDVLPVVPVVDCPLCDCPAVGCADWAALLAASLDCPVVLLALGALDAP